MKIFFLLITFIFPQSGKDTTKINLSFLNGLKPKDQVQRIIDTSDYLNNKDPRKALKFIEIGFNLLKKNPNVNQEKYLNYTKSWAYMELSDYPEARKYAEKSFQLNNNEADNKYLSDYYNLLSTLELNQSQYVKSVEYLYKGLEAAEKEGDKKSISVIYGNLGNVFGALNRDDDALDYYKKSLSLFEELNDVPNKAIMHDDLGLIFFSQKKYKDALFHFWEANKLYKQLNNIINYYWNFAYLGNTYLQLGDYTSAEKYLNTGLNGSKKYNHLLGIIESSINLGKLYFAEKKYDDALNILRRIEPQVIVIKNYDFLTSIYKMLSEIYSERGNFKYAYKYSVKYRQYSDSVMTADIEKKAREIEMRYNLEKKENELVILKQDKQLNELNLRKANNTRNYLIAIFVLSTCFFIIFLSMKSISFRKLKEKQDVINNQNETLEKINKELVYSQEQLQDLNRGLEEKVMEEIKKREIQQMLLMQKSKLESLGIFSAGIAHEINQPLTSISFSIENMLHKKHSGNISEEYIDNKFKNILEDIKRITNIINHIRIFAREQGEIKFEKFDLNEVVANSQLIINTQLKNKNIDVDLQLHEQPLFILGNKYRIEQVLLNLILNSRYAVDKKENESGNFNFRKKIIIRTSKKNGSSILEVEDNGTGISEEIKAKVFEPFFTTKEPEHGTGLGLSIVYGIVQEHKGEVTVESETNEFTRFSISLPSLN